MADNTTLNAGTGGDVIASDDIAGVKHQQVKVEWGVDGTATPVSAANPMPVVQTGTHAVNATLGAETTKVIGTVNVAAAQTLATVTTVGAVTAITNALPAGDNNIGNVDIVTVPTDPFGANADAASASGSISAKLRQIATTGIPITGTVTVGSHAVTNAGTFAVQVSSLPASTNTVEVVGDAAENAAVAGNPVLVGGRYDSTPRTLGNGDVGAAAVNASGQLLVEIAAGAGSGGTSAADGATFTRNTTSITPVGAVVETSAPTLTNGDVAGLSQTTGGALRTAIVSGGIAGAAIDTATGGTDEGVISIFTRDDTLATLTPVDGDNVQGRTNARGALWVALDSTVAQNVTLAAGAATIGALTANQSVNVAQINGVTTLMGNGASGTGAQRVTIANDSTGVLATVSTVTTVGTVTNITNQGHLADDAAFTPGTTRVMMAGFTADEGSTDSVDEGDGGAARMTLDRKQIVTLAPHTAGGPTIFRSLDIDESEEEIKASAGQIYWIHAMNMVATARYLKFYNATAASVTVGTTTPVLTFPIPANSTTGAGFVFNIPQGIPFGTAISVACTTGVADNDTGAPGANDVIINIGYL